jgi:hypothetical protein
VIGSKLTEIFCKYSFNVIVVKNVTWLLTSERERGERKRERKREKERERERERLWLNIQIYTRSTFENTPQSSSLVSASTGGGTKF